MSHNNSSSRSLILGVKSESRVLNFLALKSESELRPTKNLRTRTLHPWLMDNGLMSGQPENIMLSA